MSALLSLQASVNAAFSRWWPQVEKGLAILLLGCCLLHTGQMIHAMGTTSLSTDEFGSIGGYSSRGPLRAMTDYSAPKNHIFFSLVNSLLPGRASLDPSRARILSFFASAFFLATIVIYAFARGLLLEGVLMLSLWTFSLESLELCLEGRGYGFLALAALWCCICTVEYFRTKRSKWLLGNALAVVLGVYTVPGFLFFGGPLLLLVWAVDRARGSFFSGFFAGVVLGVLYSPVARQVIAAFTRYASQYESDFKFVQGIFRAVNLYLFTSTDCGVFLFVMVLVVASFVAGSKASGSEMRGGKVVMGAALIFFTILLYVRSAPVRMANMGMVPFAFAGLFALGAIARAQPIAIRATCFGVAVALVAVRIFPIVQSFQFYPHEDWLLAGKVFDQAFDPETRINFSRYAKYLEHSIRNPDRRSAPLNESAYLAGRLVVADAGNKWVEGRRFFRPKEEAHNAEIAIPGANRDIVLTFQIPLVSRLSSAPPALVDRDSSSGLSPAKTPVFVTPSSHFGAVVFLMSRPINPKTVRVIVDDANGRRDCSENATYAGAAIIVHASDSTRDKSDSTFELKTADPSILVMEAWAVAARQ